MRNQMLFKVIASAVALVLIVILTVLFKMVIHVNSTTVALIYLLTVVGSSIFLGYIPGLVCALSSGLLFNYYFLPPFGTFHIATPENLVAFFVYVITSFVVSHLTADLHQRITELEMFKKQLHTLFGITETYLTAERLSDSILKSAVEDLRKAFQVRYCAVTFFLPDGRRTFASSGNGPTIWEPEGPKTIVELAAEAGLQYQYDIIHLNDQTIGVLLTSREDVEKEIRKMSIALLSLLQISLPILKVRLP